MLDMCLGRGVRRFYRAQAFFWLKTAFFSTGRDIFEKYA